MLGDGDMDAIIKDLNTRYNAALDKAIASGEVKVEPKPDFDPLKLGAK
jgi:multiple sugar transport system substrate-binding protein